MKPVQNVNITEIKPLVSPATLKAENPVTEAVNETIYESRRVIENILDQKDERLLVIVGPCSIHDEKAALEYAEKLAGIKDKVKAHIYVVMRVYFEKPRTTVGWKGLINDPFLNNSFEIETGLRMARHILQEVASMGLPTGTEMLDPIVPQYISDLVSWGAIGARTTESQPHREMASGLSMPVGFKNSTEGNFQVALDAMQAARSSHGFLGIDQDGRINIIGTKGNQYGHLILRGGGGRGNFDPESVEDARQKLEKSGLPQAIIVDCSHANSGKKHEKQEVAWKSIVEQRKKGNKALKGLMLESFLNEGNQALTDNLDDLKYGVSITDPCVSWDSTVELFDYAYRELKGSV